MIQATDFVCPACKAQVGKLCQNAGPSSWRAKPHSERRKLAEQKRKRAKEANHG
jgi:hypothetical protein